MMIDCTSVEQVLCTHRDLVDFSELDTASHIRIRDRHRYFTRVSVVEWHTRQYGRLMYFTSQVYSLCHSMTKFYDDSNT
jgi:hypothetical protein